MRRAKKWATFLGVLVLAILTLPAAFLASCSSPLFDARRVSADYKAPGEGILYALPKGYVSLTIERKIEATDEEGDEEGDQEDSGGKAASLTVTMAQPEFVPDTEHLYLLKYDHAQYASDIVSVETNERGLITAVATTTKDPVPTAIRELADFLVGVATSGIAAAPPADVAPGLAPAIDTGPFKVEARFDPALLDDPALIDLKSYLHRFGVDLEIRRPPVIGSSSDNEIATSCKRMVCYRFLLPYHVVVSDPEVSRARAEAVVLLPNKGPVAGVTVVRRGLVENKFNLIFTNGVLTKAEYDDPSALVGALMIPVDMLKAIVSIPSALFRFTIARETDVAELNAERDLLDAQKQLAEKQLELLQTQQKLEEAQSGEQ